MSKRTYTQEQNLLRELVQKGIRLKYRRTFFGIIWSLIEPLMTTAVLVVIFGTVLGHREPSFTLYVLCGRLLYSYYTNATRAACSSIRKDAGIIRKVRIRASLFPLAEVIWQFLVFLISLAVLIPVAVYAGADWSPRLFFMLPALILLFFLTLGTGLFLTTCNVFLRDIEYLWNIATMLILYASAIFYYPDNVLQSRWSFLLRYNPLFCIISLFRSALLDLPVTVWYPAYAAGFTVLQLAVAVLFFRRNQERFVFFV